MISPKNTSAVPPQGDVVSQKPMALISSLLRLIKDMTVDNTESTINAVKESSLHMYQIFVILRLFIFFMK